MEENKQLKISVAMFLLYSLSDNVSSIWQQKWKHSSKLNWETELLKEISSFDKYEIEEKYTEFLENISEDASLNFNISKNRFTDYGSGSDEIKSVKELYFHQEDKRISEYNKKTGKDIQNNNKINSLIYLKDLSFFDLKIDDYGIEYKLAENILFSNKFSILLDKISNLENIQNMENISLSYKNTRTLSKEKVIPFNEYYDSNIITKAEYLERFKKSYFLNKNGELSIKTLYESNILFTKDGSAIIPMSTIDSFTSFNKDEVVSYQNIKKIGENEYFKQFVGGVSNNFIKFDKNPELKSKKIYFCEGLATALSVKQLLNSEHTVICAFNADNLVKVVKDFGNKYQDQIEIIICTDLDKPKISFDNTNSFFPNSIKEGKGYKILKELDGLNFKFTLPVFKDGIDNTNLITHISNDSYKKALYKEELGRSDYNDKNLDINKTICNLKNPLELNLENINNINYKIINKENNQTFDIKLSDLDSIPMKLKNLYKIEVANNIIFDQEYKDNFIDNFGYNNIKQLANEIDEPLILEKLNDLIKSEGIKKDDSLSTISNS